MEAIWRRYHPRLQVFLGAVPEGEREDRASEILLRAFESLDRYNPDFAFSTWLYRIARNSQVDLYRRKEPDRELLFLACYEGMPYGEISRILGRPVGTIKYEMHRIRGLLKARLEKEFCYEAE